MEYSLIHLIFVIIFARVVYGFSVPTANVKLLKPTKGIQFLLQEENNDVISNAKIFIFASKNIINNSKFLESELRRDDVGLWIYEMPNISLSADDSFEYWLYFEYLSLGYYTSHNVKVQDIKLRDEEVYQKKSILSTAFNSTYPVVKVKYLQPNKIQFLLQEDTDTFNEARIFMFSPSSIINNDMKFIENQLTRDDGGLWIYEMTSVALNSYDVIEYWLYIEKSNIGYFTSQILKVQDIIPPPPSPSTTTTPLPAPLPLKTTTLASTNPILTATTSTTPPTTMPCEASVSTVNGKSVGCKNSIIFNEDFNSDNLKYWSFDTRFPLDDSTADAEFTVYEKRSETSFIRDDVLVIKAESLKRLTGFDDTRIRIGNYNLGKERCTPISDDDDRECERQASFGYILPPVTSAYLTTRNKFTFMYGRIQARIRAPVGDYLYAQITLQQSSSRTLESEASQNVSSQHMKLFFIRGNEILKDGNEEVGGSRAYGGAILSKNPKNNLKWLKSKHFPNSHLGNDFHIYELLWSPTEISLSIDGINYGSLSSNLRESAMAAKIKSAVNWANNGPFDKEHFISINVAAGSVKNFYSLNSTLRNGNALEPKPWNDTDPKAERSFYLAHDKWYPTWKRPSLDVDYIKIYAV